jgi:type IV pilus assembly protein PilM
MFSIIKNVFLPEKIGTYYLFSKYIVGITIGRTSIIATKSRVRGKTITIEHVIEEKIETASSEESDFERITKALKNIFAAIGAYDEIHTVLPSSLVLFKELTLPFISREKIGMVIGFEIEPLLPFALRNAVIDFVITKQRPENQSSEVIVTAVQKQHIIEHLRLFEAIEAKPSVITVDAISLYSLYTIIPSYVHLEGGVALIDIGLYYTRITLIKDKQLKMIRTLPKGVIALTKKVAHDSNITPQEAIEQLIRFGLESENDMNRQSMETTFDTLWDDIAFTLQSFSAQFLQRAPFTKAIILGEGSLINGLISSCSQKLKIPCEEFRTQTLQEVPSLIIKNDVSITPTSIISISATIPSELTVQYNLENKEFIPQSYTTLIAQISIALICTVSIFATLISHYKIQTNRLKKELYASEQEALVTLKKAFKNLEDERKLNDAIDAAEEEIKKQKETWFAFSSQSRSSFLQYLLELHSRIDVKSTGIEMEQLSFGDSELILKARVKDYEALKILERELAQSPLFSYIEPQENLQFTMKITLAQSTEEI